MEIQTIGSGSKGNCYVVSDGKTKVLLEAGITYRKILKAIDFDIGSIDGSVVTHFHL